ncbi:MAG: AAA family ATPase [Candidatus Limimorpha sp.]
MIKIAIVGPESTGKSTLAEQLAQHFGTTFVPEYSRTYLADLKRPYTIDDVVAIAEGQQRLIAEAEATQGGFLIADTEMLVNKVWTRYVFHCVPPFIEQAVRQQHFDLYLLCDVDLEWRYDPLRENPDLEERKAILALYIEELQALHAPYHIVSGNNEARLQCALKAIDDFRKTK